MPAISLLVLSNETGSSPFQAAKESPIIVRHLCNYALLKKLYFINKIALLDILFFFNLRCKFHPKTTIIIPAIALTPAFN